MKRHLFCGVIWLSLAANVPALAAPDRVFGCGGAVEQQVWSDWESNMRQLLERQLLRERLAGQGDAYALYEFQAFAENAMAMAWRCKRTERLRELARMLRFAYEQLEDDQAEAPGRRWVCRGGAVCNAGNRLLGREVVLDSVQFLGLAGALANALPNALVGDKASMTDADRRFVEDSTDIILEHLQRWAAAAEIARLRRNAGASPEEAKGGSQWLFTDNELWSIAVYADLAGLLARQDTASAHAAAVAALRPHLVALLRLFAARVSLRDGRTGSTADLDRGYWRHHPDNLYAGYQTPDQPVICLPGAGGRAGMQAPSAPASTPPPETGWDISHARRLVPVLAALERNRQALMSVFSLPASALPSPDLPRAFATALAENIWNGDPRHPMFSNYWSGANGWYRVAYGPGRCHEGYPPWGLSDAFATGGYITWSDFQPVLGRLGRRLYWLLQSTDPKDVAFMVRRYGSLVAADAPARVRARFMFLPTLVGGTSRK